MKRGMSKSGQFYLVTAVILATVIIGISAISNYSKKETSTGIGELREEIKIEGAKTLDYGVSNSLNTAQMNQLMQNLTDYYISYEGREGKDIYFLFGTATSMTVSGYQETNKVVLFSSGSSQILVTQTSGNFSGSISTNGSLVILSIDGKPNGFNISPAENFYFVITQNRNGADYIVTG